MIRICTGRRACWPPMEDRIVAALLSGSHVHILKSKGPHTILKPMPSSMSIEELFKGQEEALSGALLALSKGSSAKEIAEAHIEPVLSDLEVNAGQQMSSVYLAYMIEYAVNHGSA